MRKITRQSTRAFMDHTPFDSKNTKVQIENNVVKMYLFGNLIAKKEKGKIFITSAGWNSNTTKERLNGLIGVSISQKKGTWYLNNKEWNGEWVEIPLD